MLPVRIGEMEAFLGDLAIKEGWQIPKNNTKNKDKKIAIIGAGPSGLTCAAFLAKDGYDVTIFEKYNQLDLIKIYRALYPVAEGYISFNCIWSSKKDILYEWQEKSQ